MTSVGHTQSRPLGNGPVVLVDDNESDRYVASRCYAESELTNEFICLDCGEALLDLLGRVRDGKAEMPAIVLLDINMPGFNGFEVLSSVRSQPDFRNEPFITMLTGSENSRDAESALALGANNLVTKPFDIHEYTALFNSLR